MFPVQPTCAAHHEGRFSLTIKWKCCNKHVRQRLCDLIKASGKINVRVVKCILVSFMSSGPLSVWKVTEGESAK